MKTNSLIEKYNVPGPRYTSYPTVPFWNQDLFSKEIWMERLKENFKLTNSTEGISIYIHLPYCESLCTFCGCHKRITKRHEVEEPYIDAVLKEWQLYVELFDEKPIVKELHLGGGTPTFFHCNELERLINGIFKSATRHEEVELSFEGHPNNTSYEHLQTLQNLGFMRVSLGVQDYDEKVQKAIHRIQPFSQVEKVTNWAKELGYTSISHDIIYGLPFQTSETIVDTIQKTSKLNPDRISFYSYAHVPWIKGNGQRGFKEEDLPKNEEKRSLYEIGRQLFSENGYHEIGMDHFSKETDTLYESYVNANLHRNFMGYTSSKTTVMIGLGASSISDCETAFAQNEKNIEKYLELVNENKIPVVKGHALTNEDLILRHAILEIICQFTTDLTKVYPLISANELKIRLKEFINDDLILINNDVLTVTELGKAFVRNICMAFDEHLIKNQPKTQLFSMTI
ncbi:MAG TPA: oxygen-independent coproporphyrinogen III oxidase [Flavobacterium sp.]|nr:oxygen-independent coproporphyrinogen III oxidase [Flavobacterium sp.]